jgi:signal transduction histidine kinase
MDLSWIHTTYRNEDVLFRKSTAMIALVDSMIQTVQNIISELRPGILDVLGIYAAIEWQAGELTKMTGIPCNLTLPSEEIPLGEKISINIFRIVQELFTNIVRYANATSVSLGLEKIDNRLLLTVSDNGIGIEQQDISSPSSFGIIGIRERVLSMGGDLVFTGKPGAGTSVTVTIPFEDTGDIL